MNRNIEIKARATNLADLVGRAKLLTDSPPQMLLQEDVFFNTPHGRLKLHTINGTQSELIYYERAGRHAAKRFAISSAGGGRPADRPANAKPRLWDSRHRSQAATTLYLVGVTRIHIDQVEGLGDFVELEVVLPADWSTDDSMRTHHELMGKLNIAESALVAGAYMDLLDSHSAGRAGG